MNNLVEVTNKGIWTDSHLVAKKFGMVHAEFVKRIKSTLADYPDIKAMSEIALSADFSDIKGDLKSPLSEDCPDIKGSLKHSLANEKYYTETRHYRGTDFEVYIMNREFFSLVAMRMTTKKAREWQRKFIQAFFAMELSLERSMVKVKDNKSDIEWTSTRLIGKTARIEETDAIKEFVEYAKGQGSQNSAFYYKHLTNCTYKALGLMAQKHPKLRDEMNIYQIGELMLAERFATNKLKEYMKLARNYKDIYKTVKDDLIVFADLIKIDVIEPDLEQCRKIIEDA